MITLSNPPLPSRFVSASNKSYDELAHRIIEGRSTDYDKVRAIYAWVCKNIAYDTTYSIYHADECYEKRKGVCQAYCELFHYIAKAVGIHSVIIKGRSKEKDGVISDTGHAWLVAAVGNDKAILMDPTWGSGSVINGEFSHKKSIWAWFDTDPKFMIFTHFPDVAEYQFLEKSLSYNEFKALPTAHDSWIHYHLDIERLFLLARRNLLYTPNFFAGNDDLQMQILDMPLKRLVVGHSYTFKIRLLAKEFGIEIINGIAHTRFSEWTDEGEGIYSINYIPRHAQEVRFCCNDPHNTNNLNVLFSYDIALSSSDQDTTNGQEQRIWSPDEWANAGITPERRKALIEAKAIVNLPTFYTGMGALMEIVEIPMDSTLRVGQCYTFKFRPRCNKEWGILENKIRLHKEWTRDTDGTLYMTITPTMAGPLYLSFSEDGRAYRACIGYTIER